MSQHVYLFQVNTPPGIISMQTTIVDNQETNLDLVLAASTVNKEVDVDFLNANVKSLILQSVGGDCTIQSNTIGGCAGGTNLTCTRVSGATGTLLAVNVTVGAGGQITAMTPYGTSSTGWAVGQQFTFTDPNGSVITGTVATITGSRVLTMTWPLGDTYVMTAGQTAFFLPSVLGTNPFPTANVTKLYLNSTSGTTFKLRSILHTAI